MLSDSKLENEALGKMPCPNISVLWERCKALCGGAGESNLLNARTEISAEIGTSGFQRL